MNTCYNSGMPIFEGKRLETVPIKFNEAEKRTLQKIQEIEDRPLGYIIRELCWRGFIQYLQDKNLKVSDEDINFAKDLILNNEQVEKVPIERGLQPMKKTKATGELKNRKEENAKSTKRTA